jgi:hypothetical protein
LFALFGPSAAFYDPQSRTDLRGDTAIDLAKLLLHKGLFLFGRTPSTLAVCQIISTEVGHLISKTTAERGVVRMTNITSKSTTHNFSNYSSTMLKRSHPLSPKQVAWMILKVDPSTRK